MKSIIKKAVAALAIAKGIDKIQEMRKPKRSFASRMSPMIALAGVGAGVFYLNKTGKLQPLVEKAKAIGGNDDDVVLEESLRPPTASTV